MRPTFDADVLHGDTEFPGDDLMLTHVVRHDIMPDLGAAGEARREPWEFYVMGDAWGAHGVTTETDAHAAVSYVDYLARPSSERFAGYCETVAGTHGEREGS